MIDIIICIFPVIKLNSEGILLFQGQMQSK